ncbi:MAG: ATP-binding cassette domain-containing protein [Christensenellales bacterium]
MKEILLSLQGVDMNYAGGYVGLSGVEIQIPKGEITTVAGECASGKSNLARTICGLERPSGGTITFCGKNLVDISLQERNFGLTFGRDSYQPKSTIRQSVVVPLQLRGQNDECFDNIAELTEINDISDMPIAKLDDCQLAKVSIARLFAPQRNLYVADNVLAPLGDDRYTYLDKIKPLMANKTVLWLTDNLREAEMLSQQTYIMGGCKIVDRVDAQSRPNHVATALLRGGELEEAVISYTSDGWNMSVGQERYKCRQPIDDVYKDKKILAIRLINGQIDVNNYFDCASQYNVAKRRE